MAVSAGRSLLAARGALCVCSKPFLPSPLPLFRPSVTTSSSSLYTTASVPLLRHRGPTSSSMATGALFQTQSPMPQHRQPPSHQQRRYKSKGGSKQTKGSRNQGHGRGEEEGAEEDARHRAGDADSPGQKFDMEVIEGNMKRAVERAKSHVTALVGRVGRVSPSMLDPVRVELPDETGGGGSKATYSLREIATVGVRDGALLVTCFDPEMVKHVERAIHMANLGVTPQKSPTSAEEGVLRVPVPKPTSDTRQMLVKEATKLCENARVSVRAARHQAQKEIKADVDGKAIGQSEGTKEMKKVEELTKKHAAEVDQIFERTKKMLLEN